MKRPIVWQCGGGTQSVAIGVLIRRGLLPKPDVAIMADTSREATETWDYLGNTLMPGMREAGVEIQVIKANEWATNTDLFNGEGTLIIPAYDEKEGKLSAFCSTYWKRDVCDRWLRANGYGQDNPIISWLGYSTDESKRMHRNHLGWINNQFPLIDLRISRAGCVELVESEGWPTPPKSSCWMCPHRRDWQWKRMKETQPQDFERACLVDDEINAKRPGTRLHKSRLPLALVDFSKALEPVREENLFRACESGYCWL